MNNYLHHLSSISIHQLPVARVDLAFDSESEHVSDPLRVTSMDFKELSQFQISNRLGPSLCGDWRENISMSTEGAELPWLYAYTLEIHPAEHPHINVCISHLNLCDSTIVWHHVRVWIIVADLLPHSSTHHVTLDVHILFILRAASDHTQSITAYCRSPAFTSGGGIKPHPAQKKILVFTAHLVRISQLSQLSINLSTISSETI